ncbi:MAG: hypothetical protein P9X24_17330 [Candidatus Hatepunaea meridiana]|nr:hypothetical protein [Candidatus Hatepunaea meridiana]
MKFANPVEQNFPFQTFQVLIRILLLDDPDEIVLGSGYADATLLNKCLKLLHSHLGDVQIVTLTWAVQARQGFRQQALIRLHLPPLKTAVEALPARPWLPPLYLLRLPLRSPSGRIPQPVDRLPARPSSLGALWRPRYQDNPCADHW